METRVNQVELKIDVNKQTTDGEKEPIPEPPKALLSKKKLSRQGTVPGGVLQKKKKLSTYQIDDIVRQVLDVFPDGVNVSNLMEVLVKIMTLVKDFANLGGVEKKELVVELLCHIVDETDSGDLEVLDPVIKMIIPHAIDLFVETEKGRIKFTTKKVKKIVPCVKC